MTAVAVSGFLPSYHGDSHAVLLHLVGDLFELYDDARTYKPKIKKKMLA
jgi:hypothetical protein